MALDVNLFLNAQFDGTPNSVKRTPVPAGEYVGMIEEIEMDSFPGKKDPSKTYVRADFKINIDDAGVKALLEREKVVMTYGTLIDLTDAGAIDFSKEKNINLGRIRTACDMNTPGTPWSFPMFKGKMVRVKVDHEMYQGEPQAKITAVTHV